jgi:pyruvate formate lyase activating enzyme
VGGAREIAVITGRIFDIQRFSVQDGPGIRTTVFMKGCPLACPWCSNPESQKTTSELGHIDSLCDGCGRCVEACGLRAISVAENGVEIDRKLCDDCASCADVCIPGALKVFGREISVEDAFAELKKDELYYRNSKGGVTASGGEPLGQPEFVAALFERCHAVGIHTALDTCGLAGRPALEKVLLHTDLVLFDLKLMDPAAHVEIARGSNGAILDNARRIAETGIPLILRIPLVRGLTETDENIGAIARFAVELGDAVRAVHLLPYHRFGLSKYQMLDLEYELGELKPPSAERARAIADRFQSLQLDCEIVT